MRVPVKGVELRPLSWQTGVYPNKLWRIYKVYGQGRQNELFSGEEWKIFPFIYPRCWANLSQPEPTWA